MNRTRKITVWIFCLVLFLVMIAPAMAGDQVQKKININKATVEELTELKRIGPAYAQRIVDFREQHGPFQKPEDIMLVQGIGERTWEANKESISVE